MIELLDNVHVMRDRSYSDLSLHLFLMPSFLCLLCIPSVRGTVQIGICSAAYENFHGLDSNDECFRYMRINVDLSLIDLFVHKYKTLIVGGRTVKYPTARHALTLPYPQWYMDAINPSPFLFPYCTL